MLLFDMVVTRSCISEMYYHTIGHTNMKHLIKVTGKSASETNLQSVELLTCPLTLVQRSYTFNCIVCKHLQWPLILNTDYLKK